MGGEGPFPERHDLLRRLEQARRDAEEAQERFSYLARASEVLGASLDYETTLSQLAALIVPGLADWCSVDLAEGQGSIRNVAVAHFDPARVAMARELRDRYPPDQFARVGVPQVVRTGRSELYPEIPASLLEAAAVDAEHLALIRELGLRSAIVVPLRARGRTFGALTLVTAESGRRYTQADLALVEQIGERAGLAIDNARLYRREHEIASMLQRSLLPGALPEIPGLEVAARFHAAGEGVEVGGDFYDVHPVGEGRWALAVGDVCGRGPEAAALTSMARYAARALSQVTEVPSELLVGVNRTMLQSGADRFCTMVYAVARPSPEGASFTLSRGGHPPPLVLRADGRVESVDVEGTLIGIFDDPVFEDRTLELGPGDALLLFTDGLIERNPFVRDRADLISLLGRCRGLSAEGMARLIERECLDRARPLEDDIAMLILRVVPERITTTARRGAR
jgi:serine phosphatase RsbU (regulator of sigma subunit)